MNVEIRQCCCALHTFVRITCILLLVLNVLVIVGTTLWHVMKTGEEEGRPNWVVFVLILVFSSIGIAANLLVLLAIHINKRMLMLPWLVYQLMVILGCFGSSLYIGLYFTILAPADLQPHKKAYAVICLFPLVGGIFLIFLWLFVDQLFIQMRTIKMLGMKSVSSSNLSQLRHGVSTTNLNKNSNGIIVHYSNQDTIRSIRSINGSLGPNNRNKTYNKYHTRSLPRPTTKEKRHKIKEFSYQLDLDPSNLIKTKRTKSLEQILGTSSDQGSSSTASSTEKSHVSSGTKSPRAPDSQPNVWIEDRRRQSSDEIPSYCTIDRTRLKKRQFQQHPYHKKDLDMAGSLTMPRRPRKAGSGFQHKGIIQKNISKSVEVLDQLENDKSYIGNLEGLDELKRVSSEYILDKKCVKIHPKVTEIHYSGDEESDYEEDKTDANSNGGLNPYEGRTSFSDEADIIPEPVFPSRDLNKSKLLNKISLGKKTKPSFTKDQIIDFYCHQNGDVQL